MPSSVSRRPQEGARWYGRPEIFNTDQGSQFTSDEFTSTLKRHGVMISMDGGGLVHGQHLRRAAAGAASRTKKSTSTPMQRSGRAKTGIGAWLSFNNDERPHQSLGAYAAANLPRRPVDMWTIGSADRLPSFPSSARKAGKCSSSTTYPQALQPTQDLILMK